MRALRWIVVVATVGTVLVIPTAASANGGAYIEFDKTHYLPGTTATGEAYVYLRQKQQGLLEQGPFYAYLLSDGTSIREGRPLPDSAIRLGAFSIERQKPQGVVGSRGWFELSVSFTVPELGGDFYSVMTCNDPCTIAGFREPLSGVVSVVQTEREGALLTQSERQQARIYGLRRSVRKTERQAGELEARLAASERERTRLTNEAQRLNARLADAQVAARAAETDARPLVDPWAAVGLAIALLCLAGIVAIVRRRPERIVVPDTVEALERPVEERAARR
jgi:hypothetical protein